MKLSEERIVLTGGNGFLGRHLEARLRRKGAKDIFIPRKHAYDLTNEQDVVRLYLDARPSIVIHLAAEVGGIGANLSTPGRFFYANMAMGLHMIEHARKWGVKKFVQVGTICSYPKLTKTPFKEDDLWNGYPEETNAPYGIAKKTLLTMLQAYRQQYELNGIYLMPVNLYGPGDNFDPDSSHVIPAMIRKFCYAAKQDKEEVMLWGTGQPGREFLYVEDAARAIEMALQDYEGAAPVNLGAGREITMSGLAKMLAHLIGYEGKILWDDSMPDGQPRRRLDITRARDEFGFLSLTTLEEGLKSTIGWWRKQCL